MGIQVTSEICSLSDKEKTEILTSFADCCSDLIQDIADEYDLEFNTVLYLIEARINLIIPKPVHSDITHPNGEH